MKLGLAILLLAALIQFSHAAEQAAAVTSEPSTPATAAAPAEPVRPVLMAYA